MRLCSYIFFRCVDGWLGKYLILGKMCPSVTSGDLIVTVKQRSLQVRIKHQGPKEGFFERSFRS